MALVFKTPKTAINTTTRDMQNLSADCPPCPECPEVELTTAEVEYTENGSFTVTPESGFDGLSQVDVRVNVEPNLISTATFTSNGTYSPQGYDGYREVLVSVQPTLQEKTATPTTSQQVITADSGNDGLSQVTVEGVTSAIDANIQPENILEGITILGVEGSDQGYATGYDEGFQAGQEQCGGYQSPWTLNETIPENGTYTFNPSDYCAASDPDSGECTVLSDCFDQVTITVDVPSCPDWSSIGWDCSDVTASGIEDDIAYSAQKKAEYEAGTISDFQNDRTMIYAPSVPLKPYLFKGSYVKYVPKLSANGNNLNGAFEGCKKLKVIRELNTTGVTNMANLFYQTNLEEAPEMDMSSVTNASYMFAGSNQYDMINVKTFPQYDTSSVQNMSGMFSCGALTTAPSLNTSSVTNMNGMFSKCSYLETVPLYNTSSVTNMKNMFSFTNISTIPQFDTSNVESVDSMFSNCSSLTNLPVLNLGKAKGLVSGMLQYCPNLTTLGGFIDFGKSFDQSDTSNNSGLYLAGSPLLTKQSIMNVINNLAAPIITTIHPKLTLSAESYALLTEEDIAIATAKNWSVVSA